MPFPPPPDPPMRAPTRSGPANRHSTLGYLGTPLGAPQAPLTSAPGHGRSVSLPRVTTEDGAHSAFDGRLVPRYPIESVDRTLTVLQMLAGDTEVRLSEVRSRIAVGQSTAHRLLAMLVYRGFAIQDPVSRAYRAGPALIDLRQGVGVEFSSKDAIRAVLTELAEASGETASFAVLSATDVRYVDTVESRSALRVIGRIGQTRPAHATSIGRAMLAAEGDVLVRARYENSSEPSAATVDTLLDELRRTSERGYAVNHGDVELGISSAAIAIVDHQNRVMGGLSIAAPDLRWSTRVEREHVARLQDAASKLLQS